MKDLLAAIANNKKVCTGALPDYGELPGLIPQRSTKAEFDSLVTAYYTLFRECMSDDVAFLRSVEGHRDIASFDKTVYLLRTAAQHNDNPQAMAFYLRWTKDRQPWPQAAEGLAQELSRALTQLARVSGRVRRDKVLSKAWMDRASIETNTIFEAVCRDLNVQFGVGNQRRLVRNVDRRLQLLSRNTNMRAEVKNICAQEIASQALTLPVPYFEILDRLGLMGKPNARAALIMAYSLHASTRLTGEEFLLRVAEIWKVANS